MTARSHSKAPQKWIRWAIIGSCGLYVGQSLARKDAVRYHVTMLFFFPERPSDELVREVWKKCRRKGDAVIKVSIRPITRKGK